MLSYRNYLSCSGHGLNYLISTDSYCILQEKLSDQWEQKLTPGRSFIGMHFLTGNRLYHWNPNNIDKYKRNYISVFPDYKWDLV